MVLYLKDGRKAKKIRIVADGIWATVDGIESKWNLNGSWRDDGVPSTADLILTNYQPTLWQNVAIEDLTSHVVALS